MTDSINEFQFIVPLGTGAIASIQIGSGATVAALRGNFARRVCCDLGGAFPEQTRQGVEFLTVADRASQLPLETDGFECVLLPEIIGAVSRDRKAVPGQLWLVREAARALKPGGTIALTATNRFAPSNLIRRSATVRGSGRDTGQDSPVTLRALSALLKSAGFHSVDRYAVIVKSGRVQDIISLNGRAARYYVRKLVSAEARSPIHPASLLKRLIVTMGLWPYLLPEFLVVAKK